MVIRGVQGIAHKCGFHVSRISNASPDVLPFGRTVWVDIARLSKRWGLPINCVFDVGANVGQTSLAVLAHFPNVAVYSFEPHPETFKKLAESLEGRRAQPFNIALGDKSREAPLFTYDYDVLNSLSPTAPFAVRFGKIGKPIPVRVLTVDEFCSLYNVDAIDVLKLDTEGCDLDVLKGAPGKLKSRKINFVYAEFNELFERAGQTGGALVPIYGFLEPFGFRFITSYTDYVVTDGEFFAVHNALFATAPAGKGLTAPGQLSNSLPFSIFQMKHGAHEHIVRALQSSYDLLIRDRHRCGRP
jgi:FkbM family methyltransferase